MLLRTLLFGAFLSRLEYISLWQKSRGWATEWDEDIAGYDESRPPRSPTSSVGASQTCSSPGSTASSAPSSAQVLSSLESSGEDVDTEAPVWPAGISGRSTMARSRTRRAAAHEEVVAAKARLEVCVICVWNTWLVQCKWA